MSMMRTGGCASKWRRRWDLACGPARNSVDVTDRATGQRCGSRRRSIERSPRHGGHGPCESAQVTEATPTSETAITMLTATLVRGAQDSAVQAVLEQVAETARPAWQRAAMMRGAEVALLGALLRQAHRQAVEAAAVRQRLVAAEMRTAPGARGGPGGAPAFPREGGPGAARLRPTMLPPVAGVVAVAEVVRITATQS